MASPWDIPVESIMFTLRQEFPAPDQHEIVEARIKLRLRRALEQAYTLGRQDGQKLERGKSVVVAMEPPTP
jgi:hypothetical protein